MQKSSPLDYRVEPWSERPATLASWIWDKQKEQRACLLRFTLKFSAPGGSPLQLAVTADQRYQLRLDGEALSYGPDRSDVAHWSVAFLSVPEEKLPAGSHKLEALVWWWGEHDGSVSAPPPHFNPPMAQTSWRGGFFLAGKEWAEELSTGRGDWKVLDLTAAVSQWHPPRLGYHDIGGAFTYHLAKWQEASKEASPVELEPPDEPNLYGLIRPGWKLAPSPLPEQVREPFREGRIRAVRDSWDEQAWTVEEEQSEACTHWQKILAADTAGVTISPHQEVSLLWDTETYVCGYPHFAWSGGEGAEIECQWAESLYQSPHTQETAAVTPKGNRDEIQGKAWLGFGDTYLCSGRDNEVGPALWWRSGRYLRLRIRTQDAPLTVEHLGVLTSRYPLETENRWQSSDPQWDKLLPLLHHGVEMNAHETWVDCPYYEQMMYVGDTRIHALNNYVAYRDDRLSRRSLQLFDWSRHGCPHGLVAERYPSFWRQESTTYAMIWVWMVRDFMMWRDDPAFVRSLLPGVRQMMESLLALLQPNGLFGVVPGWPFIDHVPEWQSGCGPGVREGDSSLVNLHGVLTFQAAGEIESAFGEPELAARWELSAGRLLDQLRARYWDSSGGFMRDSKDQSMSSEHAQVLAVLTGLLTPQEEQQALAYLLDQKADCRCSVYFSHYLLEAYARTGQAKALSTALSFWRQLPAQGFVCLPEAPEPTRSDCHGWGAHPLYHTYASLAGVRPASPGFHSVEFRPLSGLLKAFSLVMPHPQGSLHFQADQLDGAGAFQITLPAGVRGRLYWKGQPYDFVEELSLN